MSLLIAAFIFPLIPTSLSIPAAEKDPHSMVLPPCFIVGMVSDQVVEIFERQSVESGHGKGLQKRSYFCFSDLLNLQECQTFFFVLYYGVLYVEF